MNEAHLTRRRLLLGMAGTAGLGMAGAVYNSVLGYGTVGLGTNLRNQARNGTLGSLLDSGLRPTRGRLILHRDEGRFALEAVGDGYVVEDPSGDLMRLDDPQEGSGGQWRDASIAETIAAVHRDRLAMEGGDFSFAFLSLSGFLERVSRGDLRPATVGLLRGSSPAPASHEVVRAVTDCEPTDVAALIESLADGFAANTQYNVSRFVAGSIDDNLLAGRGSLRSWFSDDTDLASIHAKGNTGVFCGDLTRASMAAFHAAHPGAQNIPVVATYVVDRRHKHIFTGVMTLLRDAADRLIAPVTFLDYTLPTLLDDLHLEPLVGGHLDAFDERHRADYVRWQA